MNGVYNEHTIFLCVCFTNSVKVSYITHPFQLSIEWQGAPAPAQTSYYFGNIIGIVSILPLGKTKLTA